jgi:hypothetical protein
MPNYSQNSYDAAGRPNHDGVVLGTERASTIALLKGLFLKQRTRSHTHLSSADANAAAVNLTGAPGAGVKAVIHSIYISTLTAMIITLKEETSGTVLMRINVAANSNMVPLTGLNLKLPVANKKLQAQTSAAGQIDFLVEYTTEA